ncbi:MAG: hypothetical protein IJE49_05050 [Agathobacter sp.]|nr:hypothetical protein [Agathobacter sp.]
MKILDTTIRDGSYCVDFKFSKDDVSEIVDRVSKLGFEYIEIGHGKGLNASSLENGLSLQTDEEYMEAANAVSRDSKIGFFCIPGIARLEDLSIAARNNMKFVRIGENADEIENVRDYVYKAKEEGLEVMVNFMKTYIISPQEFAQKAALLKEWGADCVYVVDSSGGMLPEQIVEYYKCTKELSDIKIGLHCHNNMGLAVYNSLLAYECGYDFIDTTLQGAGRSVGNAMTEAFIMALEKKGINTGFDIPRLLEYGYCVNKNIIGRPSINPLDSMCGYADFHSSYLKQIYRCCLEKKVDPLRLIMEYCKYDKKGLDYQKLCEVAEKLPIDNEENPYDFRKYFESIYR